MEKLKITLAFQKADYIGVKPNKYERLIKWHTKSDYYHVELVINDLWISALDYRGFRMNKLRPLTDLYDYHTFYVTVTDKLYIDLMGWLEEQVGKGYDWYGLTMAQIFRIALEDGDKWICSEIVTKILQILGVKSTFDLDPIMTSPGDLARLFNVHPGKTNE